MNYAVPYARFSSSKQAKGNSLQRQEELIAKWLSRNPEYKLFSRSFVDLGRSGASGEHLKHGFGRLLEAIDAGDIGSGDVILVEAIDRAGRLKELEMFAIFNRITSAGVKIITLQDGSVYSADMSGGELWQLVGKVQQAYQYSVQLSQRIRASWENKRKMAAAGVTITRKVPVWLNSDGTLREDIAPFMRQIFEDYVAGLGERRILNRLRGKHPAFEKLHSKTILTWIKNREAIGYWNESLIYPPVVSKELFYQAQMRVKKPGVKIAAARTHFLSGIVKCALCGSNMTVKRHRDQPYSMACGKRARTGVHDCRNSKTIPIAVLAHVCNDTATQAVQQALSQIELSESTKKALVLEGEIEAVSKKLQGLAQMVEAVGFTQELADKIRPLKELRERLKEKLELARRSDDSELPYDKAWDFQYELLEDDPARLNALLQKVSFEIRCSVDGAITTTTKGNELSDARYLGYNRVKQTFDMEVDGNVYRVADLNGSFVSGRAAKLRAMLDSQIAAAPVL